MAIFKKKKPASAKSDTKQKTKPTTKKTSKKEPTNIYYVTAREEKNKKVGWEVKRGSAAKVSAFLKTKEEALEKVRELARNSEATVMIYRADGSLQDTITFNKK